VRQTPITNHQRPISRRLNFQPRHAPGINRLRKTIERFELSCRNRASKTTREKRQSCGCVVMMMESAEELAVYRPTCGDNSKRTSHAHVHTSEKIRVGSGRGCECHFACWERDTLSGGPCENTLRLQFHPFGSDRMVESSSRTLSLARVSQGRPNRFNQLK
jgi:hypothetical protein